MKKWIAAALALCMLVMTACTGRRVGESEGDMYSRVRRELESAGVELSEEVLLEADAYMQEMQRLHAEFARMGAPVELLMDGRNEAEEYAHALLQIAGWGKYEEDTGEWAPLSDDVYTLDMEAWDMENMYTRFLQGVEAIADDVTFTQVEEEWEIERYMSSGDPYGMSRDGSCRVTFLCNGHPYAIKLDSYGDWFNAEFLEYIDGVLLAEGAEGRLYYIEREMDLAYLVVYGDRKKAHKLAKMVGGEVSE